MATNQQQPIGWNITPLNTVAGAVIKVHGNDYQFHCKTSDLRLPPLWALGSYPFSFFDAESGKEIIRDSSNRLLVVKSEFTLRVVMEGLRENIAFKSVGMTDKTWSLGFI